MDIIQLTRELGKALQQDQRYISYSAAKKANDADEALQKKITEFHSVQMEARALTQAGGEREEIQKLNTRLTELYNEITANPNMVAFEKARGDMDSVLESINFIITCAANGNDPMTCPETPPPSCGGSCAGCSGCG
ncbi:MAG: YlbF family regulator [Oscillospiraceae bacterium]|nr:YlbF family regulator [Oscillospiraceae bacterium]